MTYTNDMRYAVRAMKNPTPLPIDVGVHNDQITLIISKQGFQRLTPPQQRDFMAYAKQVIRIIELGGGGRVRIQGVDGLE
jgi:hypothetical protein